MLDIYFNDHRLRDNQIASKHIISLANTVKTIEGLYLHEYPNIKRLKGTTTIVWRYRSGDFRVIFTTGSNGDNDFVIIHRVGNRNDIYKRLPQYFPKELNTEYVNIEEFEELIIDDQIDTDCQIDTQFQDYARYYKLPQHILKNFEDSDDLVNYIISGNYLVNPCLTSRVNASKLT